MAHWEADSRWEDQKAYILGGGPSLKAFDMTLLQGKNVVGCNDAYKLGREICPVVYFLDPMWYDRHLDGIEAYDGEIVTCQQDYLDVPGINVIKRFSHGLHQGGVGYNGNSGAGALNLALLFGATKIYLLGFDMDLGSNGEANWHPNDVDKPNQAHYSRFMDEFKVHVIPDWKEKFSHVSIVNLNADSKLEGFPKADWRTHQWQE